MAYPNDPTVSRRRAIGQLAAAVGVGIGLPAAIGRLLPRSVPSNNIDSEVDFDPDVHRAALGKGREGWILIGNSMLNSRISSPYLKAASGWSNRKLALGGTRSAVWWLLFKNVLVASGARPPWVTIFFRETDLTWPDYHITGRNEVLIQRLRTRHEPEWDQVMAGRETIVSSFAAGVDRFFGGGADSPSARRRVQNAAFKLTALDGGGVGQRRLELNELFSLDQLRGDLGDEGVPQDQPPAAAAGGGLDAPDPGIYAQGPTLFDPSPSASFLPHFVAMAARHNIRLHFHRVKRRPDEAGRRPDLPMFRRYLDDLQQYLLAHNCAYSDESTDPEITLAWYQDGDHINKARHEAFAARFWNLVGDQIGPPPSGRDRVPRSTG